MFVDVRVIITIEQLWKKYPGLSLLNYDGNTSVVCDVETISASVIKSISKPPSQLVQLDLTYHQPSLQPLCDQVL